MKQLVYESKQPGNLGVRKTVRMFDPVSREPITTPGVHVNFERQQTEPDAKGRVRVYGVATIGERFLEDHNMTFQQIHELVMSKRMQRAFGEIKCIVGPDTVLPDEVQAAEAADDGKPPVEPKLKGKK